MSSADTSRQFFWEEFARTERRFESADCHDSNQTQSESENLLMEKSINMRITNGEFDDDLDSIIAACKSRTKKLAYSLVPGDTVTLTGISPKYLNGARAVVTGFARTKVTIELVESVGRFDAGFPIKCPASAVRKVA